jgi:hypothetical protein
MISIQAAATECVPEAKATDTDVSLLILKKPMVTRSGRCLLACIMRNLKIVDEVERKLNKEGFLEFITVAAKNDAEIIKKITDFAAKCDIPNEDMCEQAVESLYCVKKAIADAKIKIDIGV